MRYLIASLLLIIGLAAPANAWTVRSASADDETLLLERGRSAVIEASAPFATLVVADPNIADAMATSDRSFFLRGAEPGHTTVLIYDERGDLIELIDVQVALGLDALRGDLEALLPGEEISVHAVHDGIFLDGQVTTAEAADLAMKLAERHVPNGVANGMRIGTSEQVLLEVRFVEASRQAVKEFGIGNSIVSGDFTALSDGGTFSGLAARTVATVTNVGTENIDLTLSALEDKGVLRTLARPNLVALSGDTASFLAGGEFPVPVAGDGDGNVSISFRKFGVSLEFTPTVLGDGLVNLKVTPEVSALDTANSIRSDGFEIPALSVRRADTAVELRDGQAFAIAGLLQNSYANDIAQTPWLGNVPVIGALFSSKRYQRNETELVIIITPRLVQPAPSVDAIRTPLDHFTEPTETQLMLENKTIGDFNELY
ncbi:MAG: type II and III secretion system protein family protein [Pseudomonadota bacterium]